MTSQGGRDRQPLRERTNEGWRDMTTEQPDRLDRLERIVDSIAPSLDNLITAQGNQQSTIERHQEALGRLIDGQLGLQAQMGVMSQVVIETRE